MNIQLSVVPAMELQAKLARANKCTCSSPSTCMPDMFLNFDYIADNMLFHEVAVK